VLERTGGRVYRLGVLADGVQVAGLAPPCDLGDGLATREHFRHELGHVQAKQRPEGLSQRIGGVGEKPRLAGCFRDAPGKIRTCDLSLRRRALYPLSYGRGSPSLRGVGHSPFLGGARSDRSLREQAFRVRRIVRAKPGCILSSSGVGADHASRNVRAARATDATSRGCPATRGGFDEHVLCAVEVPRAGRGRLAHGPGRARAVPSHPSC
jgi:hypothetical protein